MILNVHVCWEASYQCNHMIGPRMNTDHGFNSLLVLPLCQNKSDNSMLAWISWATFDEWDPHLQSQVTRLMFGPVSVFSCLSGHCEEMLSFPVECKNCCLGLSQTLREWQRKQMNLRGKNGTFCQSCFVFAILAVLLFTHWPVQRHISKSVFVYRANRQLWQLWPWGWHHLIPEWVRSHWPLGPRNPDNMSRFLPHRHSSCRTGGKKGG